MILSKVINSLKSQNWTSLTLELLVLVVGIFLGLQAESWYQNKQNDKAQIDFIEEAYGLLGIDVKDSEFYLETQLPDFIRNSNIILKTLNSGLLLEEDRKTFEVGLTFLLISSAHNKSALDGIIETGGLAILTGKPTIQNKFMVLYDASNRSAKNTEIANGVIRSLLPILTRQISLSNHMTPDRTVVWESLNYDFQSLIEDKAVIRAIRHLISESNRMRRDVALSYEKLIDLHKELGGTLKAEGRLQ